MLEFLVLPGYGGSGSKHWQTHWERADSSFIRVEQKNWTQPVCADWVAILDEKVAASRGGIFLVAHSLACLLVPHWAAVAKPQTLSKVNGAFLVAVPDPTATVFPSDAMGFSPLPTKPLPFASLIIASTNDPYGSPEFARECARNWGGGLNLIGAKGHINTDSGLGIWDEGRKLLDSFVF